jgi:DNA-binding CsgD family transcriptional regulator
MLGEGALLLQIGIRSAQLSDSFLESLSPSERRILELLALGMTRKQIAQSLRVSPVTISHALTTAKEKLDDYTITEAVVLLIQALMSTTAGSKSQGKP